MTTTQKMTLGELTSACFSARWAGTKDADRATALLQDFVNHCGIMPSNDLWTQWPQGMVDKYQAEMARRGYKGGTWNRRCSMLSVLFRFAISRGQIYSMPEIRKRKEGPGRTRVITDIEEARIEAALEHSTVDRDLFILLLNTGMRLGEALALESTDVGDDANVRDSKSGKMRSIPLNTPAKRAAAGIPWGRAISARTFQRKLEQACFMAGVTGVTPHTLRHTFATRLVTLGVSIVAVQRLLGHSSVAVTMRYAHASQNDLEQAVRKLA